MKKYGLLFSSLLLLVGCSGGSGQGSATGPSGLPLQPPPPPSTRPRASEQAKTLTLPLTTSKIAAIHPKAGPSSISLQPGWNMVSVPYTHLTVLNIDQPDNILGCWGYNINTGQYYTLTYNQTSFANHNPFSGYWVYCTNPTTVYMDGDQQNTENLTYQLGGGWNLVGTPDTLDTPLEQLQYNSESLMMALMNYLVWPGIMVYQNGGYVELGHPPQALPANRSQWIYAQEPGTLGYHQTQPDGPNLIVNGSFEEPVIAESSQQAYLPGDTSVTGWTIGATPPNCIHLVKDNYFSMNITYNSQDGRQSCNMGSSGPVSISQAIATTPGQDYRLDFYIGNNANVTSTNISTQIDSQASTLYINNDTTPAQMNWKLFSQTFTASNTTTTIYFWNDSAPKSDIFIDNVKVTAIPLPTPPGG